MPLPETEECIEVHGGLSEPEFRYIIEDILSQPRQRWKNSDSYVFTTRNQATADALCAYLRNCAVAYDRETTRRWSP